MMSFKEFCNKQEELLLENVMLFEHEKYKRIPNTNNSYREDPGNTNTKTIKHSHVYAKLKGNGAELYAVNINGTGHDGSTGIKIPQAHADYFRSINYIIVDKNILECVMINEIDPNSFKLIILND